MAETSYQFSLTIDFPNHIVNTDLLTQEITNSPSITVPLTHIDGYGDDIFIWFADQLTEPEQDALFSIVHAHTGAPPVENKDLAPPFVFYLSSASNPIDDFSLAVAPTDETEVITSVTVSPQTSSSLAKFATRQGGLNQKLWRAGEWAFKLWLSADVVAECKVLVKVFRVNSSTLVKTELFRVYSITQIGTTLAPYIIKTEQPAFAVDNFDDILQVDVSVRNYSSTGNVTVSLRIGGADHFSYITTPLAGVDTSPSTVTYYIPTSGPLSLTPGSSPTTVQTNQTYNTSAPPLLWSDGLWEFVFNVASVSGAGGNLRVAVRGLDKDGNNTGTLFTATSRDVVTGPGIVTIRTFQKSFPSLGANGVNFRLVVSSTGDPINFVIGDGTSYIKSPVGYVGGQSQSTLQGNQGPQGVVGSQGAAGAGVQGPQGVVGFQGVVGAGEQGPQGNQGWQGEGVVPSSKLGAPASTSGTRETLIFSAFIPADSVNVGDTFEITTFGVASSTGTLIFRVRAGANGSVSDTQAWISTTSAAMATNRRAGFNGLLVVRSIGASGTIQCECLAWAHTAQLPTVVAAVTTPTVNTAGGWYIDITCTCSAGTWTAQSALIEKK